MKNLFILLCIMFSFGCKKKNELESKYYGKWELSYTYGGFSGIKTDYPKGNGNIISFAGKNYEMYTNNKLVKSGTFSVVKAHSNIEQREVDKIVYDGEVGNIISLNDNLLSFGMDAYDGGSSTYIKIN